MQNLKKFLQSARRLAARQTARKAIDVEENERFSEQHEQHNEYQLDQHLAFEDAFTHEMGMYVEPICEIEQTNLTQQGAELGRIAEFERQSREIQQDAPDSAFALIAGLQRPDLEMDTPETAKQLQAAPADGEILDLEALAETHLRSERTRNQRAIQRGPTASDEEDLFEEQAEEKRSVFYFRPSPSK
jgi:hypothetical protein